MQGNLAKHKIDTESLNKLINHIAEHTRASRLAGLEFVDPRNFRSRLLAEQNHVVFGRRGAGKTTLMFVLESKNDIELVNVNLEDFKDISFPNIIIQVFISVMSQLSNATSSNIPWYRFLLKRNVRKKITNEQAALESLILEPDSGEEGQRLISTFGESANAGLSVKGIKAGLNTKRESQRETSRTVSKNKMNTLRNNIGHYKKLFTDISNGLSDKSIFLILDDFYFISKSIQADFIDYFHRVTKGTKLFIKVATIRHRSVLYKRTQESYVGVESGHDIYEIDMDYTMDRFSDLQQFMRQLLENARLSASVDIEIDSLFIGDGFRELCLASGGVPRDFLVLFTNLANRIAAKEITKIGKIQVVEEAINMKSSKMANLKLDSADEGEVLERFLGQIKDFVYTRMRTNVFLVAKSDLEEYTEARQAIKELVDLRFLHLIDANTSSAPSDGRRYEAYMLDICLYENSRPRNFKPIQPGYTDEKSRKDELRAAPRLDIADMNHELKKELLKI